MISPAFAPMPYTLLDDSDLELDPAVRARAFDERRGAAARGARVAAEVDLARALARERLAPVAAQQLGKLR